MKGWKLFFCLIGVLFVIGGIYLFSEFSGSSHTTHAPATYDLVAPVNISTKKEVLLSMENGIFNPEEISFPVGSKVTFIITGSEKGEMHLHEYNVAFKTFPKSSHKVDIELTIPGRFQWQFHDIKGGDNAVGVVIVTP